MLSIEKCTRKLLLVGVPPRPTQDQRSLKICELSLSRCYRCRIAMSDDRQNDAVRSAHGRAAITTRSVDALRQYMIIPAGVSPREFLVPYSLMQAANAAIEEMQAANAAMVAASNVSNRVATPSGRVWFGDEARPVMRQRVVHQLAELELEGVPRECEGDVLR